MLPKNISTADRTIRLLTGLVLLVVAIFQRSAILLIFALFCFFEASMSWCVMYQILGINTCSCKKKK